MLFVFKCVWSIYKYNLSGLRVKTHVDLSWPCRAYGRFMSSCGCHRDFAAKPSQTAALYLSGFSTYVTANAGEKVN